MQIGVVRCDSDWTSVAAALHGLNASRGYRIASSRTDDVGTEAKSDQLVPGYGDFEKVGTAAYRTWNGNVLRRFVVRRLLDRIASVA